jgi:hypothetical protein
MKVNIIIKHGLTKRAAELRAQEMSFDKIAGKLTEETGITITDSSVQRYFASMEKQVKIAVSKSETLQAKVIEGEIDALATRKKIIDGLIELAGKSGEDRDRIAAYKEANTALDSYYKALGKFSPDSEVNNNIFLGSLDELSDKELEEIARRGKTQEDRC